jgi:uncharacterized DUF497 family protein
MKFEWNPRKARLNLGKHGISFEEATTAFRDPLSATVSDPDHSSHEHRFITFGISSTGKVLTISHTERGDLIRIINARHATKAERKIYEEG